jgi:transposase-like protein
MIPCPRCSGSNVETLRNNPRKRTRLSGRVIVRWHKCRDCGRDFRSYQIVPTRREEYEVIEDAATDVA